MMRRLRATGNERPRVVKPIAVIHTLVLQRSLHVRVYVEAETAAASVGNEIKIFPPRGPSLGSINVGSL